MEKFITGLRSLKRSWVPTCADKDEAKPGSEKLIGRSLALSVLEIPVGDWIIEASRRELNQLPQVAIDLLLDNAKDEEQHDIVLNLNKAAYGLTTPQMQSEGNAIAQQWLEHGDHPLVKAAVLESSIFFVLLPIFRFFGGASLRTASADISGDERVHASLNRALSKHLGYTWSPSLDELRKETVAWVTEGLDIEGTQYGNPDFWMKTSDNLLYSGKAPQLQATKKARMIAPFETNNANIPVYY